ncbi:MAG: nuclease domain-containing protein [Methylobacter sp.]
MSKTTKSARQEDCTIRLPGCNFNKDTTVFAHLAGVRFGHGWAIKTKFGAYACSYCHDVVDGRLPRPEGMTQNDVKLAHHEGVIETLLRLDEKGLVMLGDA